MTHGICTLPLLPMRSEKTHQSEMISQLLFGETYTITETAEHFIRIRVFHDNYEGWIDLKQHTPMDQSAYEACNLASNKTIIDLSTHGMALLLGKEESIRLLPCSNLPFYDNDNFRVNEQDYLFLGLAREATLADFEETFEETTQFYLNAPYLWGGRSVFGLDCSGYTQLIFQYYGIHIPRDAWQQAEQGTLIPFGSHKMGDLAFFNGENNNITHVGLLCNSDAIIHASGRVKIDQFDEQGIYCLEETCYSHRLAYIKRLF